MDIFNKNNGKLKDAFSIAYLKKEDTSIKSANISNIMREIRKIGDLNKEKTIQDHYENYTPFVWRFATLSSFVAVILFIYSFLNPLDIEFQIAELYLEHLGEFIPFDFFNNI